MRELPAVGDRIRVTRSHPDHPSVIIVATVQQTFEHQTPKPWVALPGDLMLLLADHDGWSVTVEVLEVPPPPVCGICRRPVEFGANGWMHSDPRADAHNVDGVEVVEPTWRALGEQP